MKSSMASPQDNKLYDMFANQATPESLVRMNANTLTQQISELRASEPDTCSFTDKEITAAIMRVARTRLSNAKRAAKRLARK